MNVVKKRIELRPDPSITMAIEKAEDAIKSIIPADAKIDNIVFDPPRSVVIIEAEKPGLAIGKQGELLREIKRATTWVPLIKRMPPIRSKLIESVRSVLYENADYRKKFLDKTGHRIYDGWIREKKNYFLFLLPGLQNPIEMCFSEKRCMFAHNGKARMGILRFHPLPLYFVPSQKRGI